MKKDPLTLKSGIITFLLLAMLAAIIFLLVMPKYQRLSSDQMELAQAKSDLADATQQSDNLEQLQKNQDQINSIKQVVNGYLPTDPSTSDFVVQVEALAKNLNVTISSFSFTAAKTDSSKSSSSSDNSNSSSSKSQSSSDQSSSSSSSSKSSSDSKNSAEFSLNFSADYSVIQQFLQSLESFPRLNTIDTINIAGYTQGKSSMDLKVTGRIFYGQ